MFEIRPAEMADRVAITTLIAESVRKLGEADYLPEQIESALKSAWGLDSQLILDETYFVVESSESQIIACGGWSYRETLFGNDAEANRSPRVIDPAEGAAKIRAFFVKPSHARQGMGSLIMQRCEMEATLRGYKRLELMATLPGRRLYEKHGFIPSEPIDYPLENDLTIRFVPMYKMID